MKLFSLMFISFFLLLFFAGQQINESKINDKNFNIYNFTENSFKWNTTNFQDQLNSNLSEIYKLDFSEIKTTRVKNIVYKCIDFIGFSSFEISKFGIEFGYEHPEYDYRFMFQFIIKVCYILIILALVPVTIPIIALFYILIAKSLELYIKIKNRLKQ